MTAAIFEFRRLATFHLLYLEEDFGFQRYPDADYDEAMIQSVSWIGPVAVHALWEPYENFVGVEILILQDGAWPRIGRIVRLTVERIVKTRAPERHAWYVAFNLRNDGFDAYLRTAAADLRLHAEDILSSRSFALVDEVRASLEGVPGAPSVDWWVL